MKVKDIIRQLSERYEPDTELVIAWWDRHLFHDERDADEYGIPDVVSRQVWDETVRRIDGDGWEDAVNGVYDLIDRAIAGTPHPTVE